ncbi:alpha-L-arabinofuranosidase C-terminal domain-containing protein [Bacteroides gallinaceum]|uniref:alpha-L-arabinofuranosidase C-terminal domain-containing protein n=1 Tax=Bacteroides gallinaceum TaxID=1462571 RepID=UPI0025AAB4F1|nr:alpha-L-arabinofuranosidase C-terminal domain-containing protein [Bacteroides gallinaceum]MDN0067550.1 alpha-L-arabinofuranosidase C-terminal domain-containing protein [Bacteroides gallinaceum]
MNKSTIFSLALAACCCTELAAQEVNHMVVKANKPGAEIQPTMYGHFFEDINYGADGGLYAELVMNRSFEFPNRLQGWKTFGNVTVLEDGPFDRNPHYIRLADPGHPHKRTGVVNEGFFGIGLKENAQYRFTVWARGNGQKIRVELIDPYSMGETQVLTSGDVALNSADWKKYELVLTAPQTIDAAQLRIFLASAGNVDLEHISLFPVDTWKGRENGLRKDLVQALVDTKPGVFRFPGGCIVEGTHINDRYQWKNSVGPVENRPLNSNRWEYTFPHRYYPDYQQTYGMGFYELFLLAEDMGAEPLPIVNVGLACQYQNDDPKAHVPVDSLQSYIQDALDLIEFANGDETTKWGKLRAEMGHPAPFNMKFIGVGNEQWGPEYPERLKYFVDAIRKAYPDIQIIGSSGPNSEGKDFDYLWPEMKKLKVDLVDEHFYRPEDWFLKSGNRYDNYDRKGPKVFAGEYACHGKGKKWNHFYASLLEAAFLTGVERNADVVYMATYAPLLAHVKGWQWRPDLIWFDNLRSVRSCSWYVQYLYGHNKGTQVVPLLMDGKAVSGQPDQNGLFASAVWDEPTKSYIVKIVNVSDKAQSVTVEFDGLKKKKLATQADCILFHSDNPDEENSLDNPNLITPKESKVTVDGKTLQSEVGAQTFVIYRVSMQE